MKAARCPHCGDDVIPREIDVSAWCRCGKTWARKHRDGLTCGGAGDVRIIEVGEA